MREYLWEILKKKKYKFKKKGSFLWVDCPFCETNTDCMAKYIEKKDIFVCYNCGTEFDWYDIFVLIYKDKSKEELEEIIKDNKPSNFKYYLDLYKKLGWSLVPVVRYEKKPAEKEWQKKIHKDPDEWKNWLEIGLNIGVKTGKDSNITVIDIDGEVPKFLQPYLLKTISQETNKGFHLFFEYEPDIKKTFFDIDNVHIDIQNDGGQVVIEPSIVLDENGEKKSRKFLYLEKIIKMPKELKEEILKYSKIKTKTFSEQLVEDISTENFNLKTIKEGYGRNNFLVHLGGLLRKRFGMGDVEYVVKLVNRHFCDPPLNIKEIKYILNSLYKYDNFDDQELLQKIFNYIKMVEECTKQDIRDVVHEYKGERIDKVLSYLIKEGYILKRGRYYKVLKKAEWKTSLIDQTKPVDFKVPYFYDIANFCWGDMLLIASKSGFGKTTLAMNIIKRLVKEGIKAYYISLEAGSRFSTTALKLGLKDGDFYWDFVPDPTKIELEPKAVTIIDWLLVREKAKTDLVFEYLTEQVYKTKGFLIVFQQLKENEDYFAPNLIQQFPAFACKFLYKNKDERGSGYFKITKVRDPKSQYYPQELPTVYDWETREVKRIEEIIE